MRHGFDEHSFTSVEQLLPEKPAGQTQEYELAASTHVAPLTHGYDEHSFTSTSQWLPAQPLAHVHEYCTAHAAFEHLPSEHVAPFMHGVDAHSLMAVHVLPPLLVS